MQSISDIINDINKINGNTFRNDNIHSLQKFIDQFYIFHQDLSYLDHGGSCICFSFSNKKKILKIYQKKCNNILQSSIVFNDYINYLTHTINLPIAHTEIVYEDPYYIAAIQPLLSTIKINHLIVRKILKIIESMLVNRVRLHDVYYRNFGLLNSNLLLFDFHESINFYDNIDLFVSNLLQLFSLLFNNNIAFNSINPDIKIIVESNYASSIIPPQYSAFLCAVHQYRIDDSINILRDKIYTDLGSRITVDNFNNYQLYNIDSDGIIHLSSHTKQKADIVDKIIILNSNSGLKLNSIIDAGCSYGAIGIYLKQKFPEICLTLNNLDNNELISSRKTAESIGFFNNINYINQNVMRINSKYDISLFFALIHHILRNNSFEEFFSFVKQITNHIAIIEFPLKGDILLDQVIANTNQPTNYLWDERYYPLKNLDSLTQEIKNNGGNIIDIIEMNYDRDGIKRFTFVLNF